MWEQGYHIWYQYGTNMWSKQTFSQKYLVLPQCMLQSHLPRLGSPTDSDRNFVALSARKEKNKERKGIKSQKYPIRGTAYRYRKLANKFSQIATQEETKRPALPAYYILLLRTVARKAITLIMQDEARRKRDEWNTEAEFHVSPERSLSPS